MDVELGIDAASDGMEVMKGDFTLGHAEFTPHPEGFVTPQFDKMLDVTLAAMRQPTDTERLKWLHAGSGTDADGYEWGVFRVKWDQYGRPIEVLQTLSDMSDLDAEMRRNP